MVQKVISPGLVSIDERSIVLRVKEGGIVLFIKKERGGYTVDVWSSTPCCETFLYC